MTRAEFIEIYNESDASGRWITWTFFTLLFLAMFSWSWIVDQVNQWGVPWLTEAMQHSWAWFILSLILFGAVSNWNSNRRTRGRQMVCMNCQAPLLAHLAAIAIATGNCGKCGKSAFDEQSENPPSFSG